LDQIPLQKGALRLMPGLLLKNAKLIDGSQVDIAIADGKITAIGTALPETAAETVDLSEAGFLTPGWIDSHVHCFEAMDLYTDFPDEIGVKKGVTTVVDAGSAGCSNIGEFYQMAKNASTNTLAFLNISRNGIVAQNELEDLSNIDVMAAKEAVEKFSDFIVGFKARMSKTVVGPNGIKPLLLAKEIQEGTGLPIMVHIGSEPPVLFEILDVMDAGDILTHCFNGKPNGILGNSAIKPEAHLAKEKGIVFDIGHGTDSFNFNVAKTAFSENLKADLISTDIYIRNRLNGPVYDLPTTMEKLMAIGYSLEEVIEKVTSAPAKALGLASKGRLEVGADADFTIFKVESGTKTLTDSNGFTQTVETLVIPQKAIVGGTIYEC